MTTIIQLSQGLTALIDDEDAQLVGAYVWQAKSAPGGNYYAVRVRHGEPHMSMHRLVAGATSLQLVDHRSGIGYDNRRKNLRVCNSLQNARHREHYVRRKRERGGYLGVSYNKRAKLWVASIHAGAANHNGEAKRISLKCYATAEEAARVFDAAALYYFGEFAALNFPDEEPAAFDLAELRGTTNVTPEDRARTSRESLQRWRERTGLPSPRSKLSQVDIDLVRSRTVPLGDLAKRFGMSVGHLAHVRAGTKPKRPK